MGWGRSFGVPSLRQDLLDAGDRLVDRLLGADALGDDPVDGLTPDALVRDWVRFPFVVADIHVHQVLPGQDLDRRTHAVRVARVEPERLVDQLAHRRQVAIAGEIQPVGEPAFLGEEADEVLGERRVRRP